MNSEKFADWNNIVLSSRKSHAASYRNRNQTARIKTMLVVVAAICLSLVQNRAQADEFLLDLEYSFASYFVPGKLDAIEFELDTHLARYNSERECLTKLRTSSTETMAMANAVKYGIPDITVRCRKYWKIENCETNLLTGEACVGVADLGKPRQFVVLLGEKETSQEVLSQVLKPEQRMAKGSYEVLQRTLWGKFGDQLLPFATKQVLYNSVDFVDLIGKELPNCKAHINHRKTLTAVAGSFELIENTEALLMRCFRVDDSGKVTISGEKVVRR